ncbi:MAG: DUF3099 domain-containing protein [Myxococcales bacterium]|nr:MAG: DUF3099 domain-containing protein [Myxococcales bacterium]
MARRGSHEVLSITTAPQTFDEEIRGRQRRYLISMAARVLCFVGAVAVGPGWLRWILVLGAVFLPYVAVVMANRASPRPPGEAPEAPTPTFDRQLPPAPDPGDQP